MAKTKTTKSTWCDVISPDGFSIFPSRIYKNEEEAKKAFSEWGQRFIQQGYYSSNRGRIPLEELWDNCKVISITEKEAQEFLARQED